MSRHPATPLRSSPTRALVLGSVSYLNAKPLICDLDHSDDLRLVLDVPSRLLEGLRTRRMDVALLPVIDYQRLEGLRVIPASGIGCDGPTLTVRIFSHAPVQRIRVMACDTDSHTSVALARVILAEKHGITPQFIDWASHAERPENRFPDVDAVLLIGDKVVCEEPRGFVHQLDLGREWRDLTGLPFVFAVWMMRRGVDVGDLPQRLEEAKRAGLTHVDDIIARFAVPRGWPADVARRYLCEYLKYDIGPRQLQAISLFHRLAGKHGMIPTPVRELRLCK